MTNPKRRWLRFSLRGMLLVTTVAAVWLGREVSIVRERKAAFRQAESLGAAFDVRGASQNWFRNWLGDSEVGNFIISREAHPRGLGDRLRRAFPEGKVNSHEDSGY
jgi:hypothetical protein